MLHDPGRSSARVTIPSCKPSPLLACAARGRAARRASRGAHACRCGRQPAAARVRAHTEDGRRNGLERDLQELRPYQECRQYPEGPREDTVEGLENIAAKPGQWQAVGDHVPLGLFRRYLPADTRYMTILREPVDRVLSHYHFHAQAGDPPGSRGATKLRGLWEQLLNNERTELGGPDETISLGEDADVIPRGRAAAKALHLRQLHDALPLGGRVHLRRVASRCPRAREGQHRRLLVRRGQGTAGRVDCLARAKARHRFDAVLPSTREHEASSDRGNVAPSFVSSSPSTTPSTSSSTALRASYSRRARLRRTS